MSGDWTGARIDVRYAVPSGSAQAIVTASAARQCRPLSQRFLILHRLKSGKVRSSGGSGAQAWVSSRLLSIMNQSIPFTPDRSSEVLFAGDAPAATLSSQVAREELRRLRPGIYTRNLSDPLEDVARRNRWAITGRFFPGGVVSDRSALPEAQSPGIVFLSHPNGRRDIAMPGLLIRARVGAGPLAGDAPLGQYPLHQASLARALVENTVPSRSRGGRPSRIVDNSRLEEILVLLHRRDGADLGFFENVTGFFSRVARTRIRGGSSGLTIGPAQRRSWPLIWLPEPFTRGSADSPS